MSSYEIHPICRQLPDMSEREFSELRNSINERGLIQPIELYEGKVLDGRHRLRACIELDRADRRPRFIEFNGGDPWLRVWDRNGARREWAGGAAQKYAVWKKLQAGSQHWLEQQDKLRTAANAKRAKAAKAGKVGRASKKFSAPTGSGRTKGSTNAGAKSRATAAGVDRGTVEKVDAVVAAEPNLLQQIASGELKLAEAQRRVKRSQVEQRAGALPDGKYRVIYADPPWQYHDSRKTDGGFGVATMRESTAAETHYPTMSVAELGSLPVRSLAGDDCVLFCWATFPLLPDALEVVRTWGFKYKTSFVWDKGRGSFSHYHSAEAELLLIATHGTGTPAIDEREKQIQRWPRGEHSAKPEEFRALIDRLYPNGPRIELFRRGASPKGWTCWGNEARTAA